MAFDPKSGPISNLDVDASEQVAEIQVRQNEVLWIAFVVGVADLTGFIVQYKISPSGTYFTVATAAADYTSPAANSPVIGASGDLTIAAAAATIRWVKLDVKGVEAVKILAAGANTTVVGWFQAQ